MCSHFHLLPQHAKELLGASKTRGGSTFIFQQEQSRVERALETALKDNNFIYHDKIPDLKSLQPIGKAVVAKATPVSQPMSAKFTGSVSYSSWGFYHICFFTALLSEIFDFL